MGDFRRYAVIVGFMIFFSFMAVRRRNVGDFSGIQAYYAKKEFAEEREDYFQNSFENELFLDLPGISFLLNSPEFFEGPLVSLKGNYRYDYFYPATLRK